MLENTHMHRYLIRVPFQVGCLDLYLDRRLKGLDYGVRGGLTQYKSEKSCPA